MAALLRQAKISFERNVRDGSYIAEFVALPQGTDGPRVVIECKFNVNRDWARSEATAMLLKQRLGCDLVVVVPYLNDLGRAAAHRLSSTPGIRVVAANDLTQVLGRMPGNSGS